MSISSTHVTVPGSERYHRAGAVLSGPADRTEWVEVTVRLRRKAALPEPDPRKPVDPAKLAASYGASQADIDATKAELSKLGLTVTATSTARRTVKVGGPVSAMEAAFDVRLLRAQHDGVSYRARTGAVHVPNALGGIVTGVFGLDSRPMVKRHRARQRATSGALPPPTQRPWFLPQELAAAYNFPAGDGAGQTIAILEFGGHYIASDLQDFAQIAGLPAAPAITVKNVHTLAANDRNDPDAIGEVMLDVEVVAGICPNAMVNLYFSQWSEQGWIDNLGAVLDDASTLSVVSVSYGLAEGADIWTQQAIDAVNDNLKELAAGGITVCVSSGDDGSDDQVGDGRAHVDFPAASPYVLAVGGTSLDRASGNEVVWFDGDGLRSDGGGATGGGVSEMVPRPAWQNFAIASANPGAPAGRIVPDVSANAAGSTGYFMVANGSETVSGGTSASTPLWAALIALLRASGKNIGFLTPLLYQPVSGADPRLLGAVVCRDITDGGNASGHAPGYSAAPGFDAVTGWGSPNGSAF